MYIESQNKIQVLKAADEMLTEKFENAMIDCCPILIEEVPRKSDILGETAISKLFYYLILLFCN